MKSALNKVFKEILSVQHEDYQHYKRTGELRYYTMEGFEKRIEEYRKNKRLNRTTMAKKEQLRDAHCHFASKEGAVKKTKKTAVDYEKLYEQQTKEVNRLKCEAEDNYAEIDALNHTINVLTEKNSELTKRYKYYEGKAKRYFDTIEAQNDLLREVDSNQLTWYRNHASWWTRLRHFKRIVKMMNVVCSLRQEVLNTMYKW